MRPGINGSGRGRLSRRLWTAAGATVFVSATLLVPAIIAYAYYAAHHMPDADVADTITASGGRYQRDSIAPFLCVLVDGWVLEYGPIIYVYHSAPITEAKVAALASLGKLQQLSLLANWDASGTLAMGPVQSEPAAWPRLAQLDTLRELTLQHTDVRDADLAHLERLPNLKRVDLWKNPNLTPVGVDRLRRARPDIRINYR